MIDKHVAWLGGICAAVMMAIVLIVGCVSPPAHAGGPTVEQPSTVDIAKGKARYVADFIIRRQFMVALSKPQRTARVEVCTGGPGVWRCPATWSNHKTRCSTTLWVWRNEETFFYETHKLNCVTE